MKALILAAGMGSRIAAEIDHHHKALLPLAQGTPLLRYTVRLLLSYGIEPTIVTGYRRTELRQALDIPGVNFFHNPFYQVTNSMASFYFALAGLDYHSDYLHLEADTFIEPKLLEKIIALPRQQPLMMVDYRRQDGADVKVRCQDGYLRQYSKELAKPYDGEACDIYLVPAATVPQIADRVQFEVLKGNYQTWWSDVLTMQCQRYPLKVADVAGLFWQEIDYYQDYQRVLNFTIEQAPQLGNWLDDGNTN